jgi:autotransporter-associated beta strand protein
MVRALILRVGGLSTLLTLAVSSVSAQSTWNGNGGDNNWNTVANWAGGVPQSLATTTVTFAGTNRLAPVQNVANPIMLNQLTFGATAGAFVLGGNGLNFVSNGALTPTITQNSASIETISVPLTLTNNLTIAGTGTGNLILNGVVGGAGSLTYSGAGTLTLGNTNTYAGGTFVNSGTLALSSGTAIPTGGNVTVGSGAQFNIGGTNNASASAIGTLTLNGGTFRVPTGGADYFANQLVMTNGTVDFTGTSNFWLHLTNSSGITINAGNSTWTGAGTSRVQNDSGAALTLTVAASGFLNAGIILSGSGTNANFVKAGPGYMRLSNTGNTANLTVSGGYVFSNDLATNLGTGAFGTLGTGSFTLSGGAGLDYDGATAATAKPIALTGAGAIDVGSAANLTMNGVISQTAAGASLYIFGTGNAASPSTLTLGATNTYSGITAIGFNVVVAVSSINNGGANGPIGASTNAPANLVFGSSGRGDLLLTGTNASYSTDRGATLLGLYTNNGGGGFGVQNAATTLTVSGQITGAGSFIKSGAGTLVLSNATNNYAGGTFVEAGTLTLGNGTAMPTGGSITVNSGAVFNTAGLPNTLPTAVGAVTLNGGGTFRIPTGTNVYYYLNSLTTDSGGGTVNTTGTTGGGAVGAGLSFVNGGISINGNSNWTGPIDSFLFSSTGTLPIAIAPGVTLTTGLSPANTVVESGGGTLYLTNPPYYALNLTVSGAVLRKDDLTGVAATGTLMSLTLDGGTLRYGGSTVMASGFALTANGGTVDVFNAATTLTLTDSVNGPAGASLTKAGPGTLILANASNAISGGAKVAAGTLSIGSPSAIPGGANVTVQNNATFDINTQGISGAPIGTVTLNGGTLRATTPSNNFYELTALATGPGGGTVNATGAGAGCGLAFTGVGAGITVNGNSSWSGPANFVVLNFFGPDLPFTVAPGVTLTSSISLASNFGDVNNSWHLTGGGTLYLTNTATYNTGVRVDQARLRIDDVASINASFIVLTLDNGTLAYGGASAATTYTFSLTPRGGTVEVVNAATTLALTTALNGIGPLTKAGPGTLILGNSGNLFNGLTINSGVVSTANDNTLGAGPITVNAPGTLQYTGSSAATRSYNLNFGTLAVATGSTLTLNGAAVNGGFVKGPGGYTVTGGTAFTGVTISASAVINQTGAGSFVNVSNSGNLTVSTGVANPSSFSSVINEGSGSITMSALSRLNVSEFQSYGTLSIIPGTVTQNFSQTTLITNVGSTQLFFNGGSRTFVGTPATAVFPNTWPDASLRGLPTFVAGFDLNGKNATVAGGLFVNNGYVEDTTSGGTGTATVVADFGALVKGGGYYQNTVITQNGGKFQSGNSPGSASFGRFVLGPGGVSSYVFAIDDATGTAGPSPDAAGHVSGWGLVKAIVRDSGAGATPGDFTWTATAVDRLLVSLQTLVNPTTVGIDVPGMMDHFDPNNTYVWPAITWTGSYAGPTDEVTLDASTTFDTSGFANPVKGTFGWALDAGGHTLSLIYTPTAVPEPTSLGLVVAAASGWLIRRRFNRLFV